MLINPRPDARLADVVEPLKGGVMVASVVIPVFNRPDLVAAAIRSAQAQTVPVLEIIVVDDASSDETPDVVAALAAQDQRIHLIRLPERAGAPHARNVGVAAAAAPWIAFLDSDDRWLPEKLERQVQRLRTAPEAVACFTGIRFELPQGAKDQPLPPGFDLRFLRRMNYISSTSTALVRRDAFLSVGGFDEALESCQDWDLWLRLAKAGPLVFAPEPLLLYSYEDRARISRSRSRVLSGHRTVFRRILAGEPFWSTLDLRAYHLARLAQIALWDFKDRRAALGYGLLSLLLRPSRVGLAIFTQALLGQRQG